jgi:adenine/guanine phosphoribosyltransferase-like PRPP-binding protein
MACITSYLNRVVDKTAFENTVCAAIRLLANVKFDAIAVQGNSGVSVGAVLAFLLNKNLIIVRKANDGSHSSLQVEGDNSVGTYIIVDDLVASGNTYARIRSKMVSNFPNVVFKGLFLYDGYRAGSDVFDEYHTGPIFISKPELLIQMRHVQEWQTSVSS